jgi:hypothetical protein
MALQRTPPPQQQPPKKSGMGCLGCGCLLVVVIFLVLAGLVGGLFYFGYKELYSLTSAAPAPVPPFTGSDDIYAGAQKKIDTFNQDVGTGKASSLTLSGDEINSLIAHDPDLIRLQIHLLATLTNDQARLQGSIPTNAFGTQFLADRYANFDATFGLVFNSDTKRLDTNLHKLQIGDSTVPENALPTVDSEFLPWIEVLINRYPAAKNAIAAAQTVAIKDGQLVVETK